MPSSLFPFRFLRSALQAAGLPSSKPTIIEYERSGIIKPGKNSIVRYKRIDRLYTKEEMGEIIRSLKEFKESQRRSTKKFQRELEKLGTTR